jgi:hypothetical protein
VGEEPGLFNNTNFPDTFAYRRPVFSNLVPLQKDMSGMTIFTQDELFFKRSVSVNHPLKRVYEFEVRDPLSGLEGDAITLMRSKIKDSLKPYISPPIFEKISEKKGRLTIFDYRPDNIDAMLLALRHDPVSIKRVAMGEVKLEGLKPGQWRILTSSEVDLICARYYKPDKKKFASPQTPRYQMSVALKEYNERMYPGITDIENADAESSDDEEKPLKK